MTLEVTMDLWQLRYFLVVAEEEHIGRAAARLHVSPSPLSRQIRQLEAQLGAALFVREGRRIRLTPLGRETLAEGRALLERARAFADFVRSAGRGDVGPVDVGFVQGACYNGTLPKTLARLRDRYPRIEPRLQGLDSARQLDALRAGRLDVAFTHRAPARDSRLQSRLLKREPFVVALAARPAPPRELNARYLAQLAWVTLPRTPGSAFHQQFESAAQALGFSPRIAIETTDVTAALGFVAAGVGAALVQESIARALPRRIVMRRAPALRMEILTYALWRNDGSPATQRLVECLEPTVASTPAANGRERTRPHT